ncbi:hypothetical protein VHEMI05705 [[Torrubiella] hemipterigena]|uniref:DUF567 domain protein n=1 Tax=[Torrubiella] hemipterigena TaxID=1531966 RepID=A0A0A1THA2_9HYPO|nr:hypothetical protein VHEMI05705 [[Torrubiella] hemipterigena]
MDSLGPIGGKLKGFLNSKKNKLDNPQRQVAPLSKTIYHYEEHVAKDQKALVISEKAFALLANNADGYDIKDVFGMPMYKIKGKSMTATERKSVLDNKGEMLLEMYKDGNDYIAEDFMGDKFMTIKVTSKLMGNKATGTFTTEDEKEHSFSMTQGSKFSISTNIVLDDDGTAIAVIDRKIPDAQKMLKGEQTYTVTIAKGFDVLLIVALCMAMDDKKVDK